MNHTILAASPAIIITGVLIVVTFLTSILFAFNLYKKVKQGQVLIVTGIGGTQVSFTGRIVIPIIHQAEIMDISLKRIDIILKGKDALVCQDEIKADIKATFLIKVNRTVEDILTVAASIGVQQASDTGALEKLFQPKFSEALKIAGQKFDFQDALQKREDFRNTVFNFIGMDLNGICVEDVVIEDISKTKI